MVKYSFKGILVNHAEAPASKSDIFAKPVEIECILCLLDQGMVLESIPKQATVLLSQLDARSHSGKLSEVCVWKRVVNKVKIRTHFHTLDNF